LYEEPTLARRYGVEYESYRRAVPGWWPRWTPWRGRGWAFSRHVQRRRRCRAALGLDRGGGRPRVRRPWRRGLSSPSPPRGRARGRSRLRSRGPQTPWLRERARRRPRRGFRPARV